jgi:hypothetical protein
MATAKSVKPKKIYLQNLVRECSLLRKPSTRLVAMVLASSADWETYECRPKWDCIMHWTKLAKSTLNEALKEITASGVLVKQRRYRQSSVYTFNIERLQELRVPYKYETPTDSSSPDPNEDDYILLAQEFNRCMKSEFGSEARCSSVDVEQLVSEKGEQAVDLVRWFIDILTDGRFATLFPEHEGSTRFRWSAIPNGYDKLWGKYVEDTQANTADEVEMPQSKAFLLDD